MDAKILEVYEEKGQLRVVVEHEYGKDNIGLSIEAKYLSANGQPRWKSEVKELLQKKYGGRKADKSLPRTQVFKEEIGKTITL